MSRMTARTIRITAKIRKTIRTTAKTTIKIITPQNPLPLPNPFRRKKK